MITCKLQGGISNQMFQIAATHALALRNNDLSGFDFNQCDTPNQGFTSHKYKNSILSRVDKISVTDYTFRYIYNELKFSYDEIPYVPELILNGYFQSEKYFVDYKKEILDLFRFDETTENKVGKYLQDNFTDKKVTSIHVRRGDYLSKPNFHPTLPMSYYNEAMRIIGESEFIIMSDDMEWVKENFKGENIHYSPFYEEMEDMCLMMLCSNNIIANSSFSWWGAYLGKADVVLAPNLWFGPDGPKDTQDVIPNNWIKI